MHTHVAMFWSATCPRPAHTMQAYEQYKTVFERREAEKESNYTKLVQFRDACDKQVEDGILAYNNLTQERDVVIVNTRKREKQMAEEAAKKAEEEALEAERRAAEEEEAAKEAKKKKDMEFDDDDFELMDTKKKGKGKAGRRAGKK